MRIREERDDIRPAEHDDMLQWMRAHGIKLTAENYLVSNGIPAEEYQAERLAEVPRKFRRAIQRMAERARRRELNNSCGVGNRPTAEDLDTSGQGLRYRLD